MILTFPVGVLVASVLGAGDEGRKRGRLYVPAIIVVNMYYIYITTAWAALCVYFTKYFINARSVSYPVIYYVILYRFSRNWNIVEHTLVG